MSTPAKPEPRREVSIAGQRVRVIDIHAHCFVPEAGAVMGVDVPGRATLLSDAARRVGTMDRQGIDIEVLSINPFWYGAAPDVANEVIRIQNEALSAFVAANAERFVAFATVSLQHPELAVEQLELAVTKQGLKGALVGGSVEGEELASPRFDPFWRKAEELGAVIFIHPQGTPELAARLAGNGMLENVIGNPLETTIALSKLIFEGTLDRFPNLKIVAAHGGGYLPSYAARSDAGGTTFPARFTPIGKKPTEYLRQLYFDSLVFTAEGLRHLVAETGAGQIVLGTDHPYPWVSNPVDHVLNTPELTDADRIAILGGTASSLLGLS